MSGVLSNLNFYLIFVSTSFSEIQVCVRGPSYGNILDGWSPAVGSDFVDSHCAIPALGHSRYRYVIIILI